MNSYTLIHKDNLTDNELFQILRVWEASVRATHHFLAEEDIVSLIPLVQSGVPQVEHVICIEDQQQEIQAFMGIHGDKIEMLFVDPELRGKGIGKKLITYALDDMNVNYVDVNEQNPQAVGFYEHVGFEVYERSELDDQGNPFPILRMKKARTAHR
ncbi:acetyltransferase [Paenibacillus terrigena]|uniref:acetyltransferase n=1 Tax=Paenibacillus terrigena TaxID=369333 RepID=UPI0003668E00|nr:acetyltransferase [Paenibacillus terrigena]